MPRRMVRNLTPPEPPPEPPPGCALRFRMPVKNATRQAAVFCFDLRHLRNDGGGAHLERVASIDRIEQRVRLE